MTATPTTISQLPAQSGALTGGERLVVDLDGATVAATAITVGGAYRILSVGTTDWVAAGAASSAVGVTFVASAVGTGTGTAVALLTRRVSAQQVADLAPAYEFNQPTSSSTWVINHNLGYKPSVELRGLDGKVFIADTEHVTVNQVVVTMVAPRPGSAFMR